MWRFNGDNENNQLLSNVWEIVGKTKKNLSIMINYQIDTVQGALNWYYTIIEILVNSWGLFQDYARYSP